LVKIGRVRSIQFGKIREEPGKPGTTGLLSRPWRTGYFKLPASGPVKVTRLGLVGDEQADLEHHGGVDKAVLGYSADHFPFWHKLLELTQLPSAAFGENLTIQGLPNVSVTEESVCLGDIHQIGSVRLEVSQPRQPCWKISRRLENADLLKIVVQTGSTGWYYRVLSDGEVTQGQDIFLAERRYPDLSISAAQRAMISNQTQMQYSPSQLQILRKSLLECSALADSFKKYLTPRP